MGVEDEATPLDASEWWVVLLRDEPERLVLGMFVAYVIWSVLSYIPPFSGIAYKMSAFARGVIHMLVRAESKVRAADKPHPEKLAGKPPGEIEEKTFYFIRHGESEWNEVFNRGKVLLLPRLLLGLVHEAVLCPFRGKSIFLDSPLCKTGIRQVEQLRSELEQVERGATTEKGKALQPLRFNDPGNASVIFCSNLKRCIETALIGLEPRLKATGEKVKLFSCLQEIAPNVDTLALSDKGKVPVLSSKISKELRQQVDPTFNLGSKRWFEPSVRRMDAFLKYAFAQRERNIIVSGHSFYFRDMFRKYMTEEDARPHRNANRARTMKIRNAGVVKCVIQKGRPGTDCANIFRIKPDSIEVVHPCPEPAEVKLMGFVK